LSHCLGSFTALPYSNKPALADPIIEHIIKDTC
jgi:hypothetical protein